MQNRLITEAHSGPSSGHFAVTKTLEKLGLEQKEAKIYLALLRLGQATATRISEETRIERTLCYSILSKLLDKALVSYMLQNNVASLPIYDNKKYITMESPVGTTISKSQAVDIPSPDDATYDVEFSYGFFEITVNGNSNGGTTTVVLYFPVGTSFDTYYKYGPTPINDIDHWYEFLYDGQTGAEMDGHVITLHFVDGQRGDDDLTVDGLVFDVGGPGITLDPSGANNGDGSSEKGGEGGGGCFIGTAVGRVEW